MKNFFSLILIFFFFLTLIEYRILFFLIKICSIEKLFFLKDNKNNNKNKNQ
jgi:hypothetical protein